MTTRQEWLEAMLRIAAPVVKALENGKLKEELPLEFHFHRKDFAPLEAFGRTFQGIAPWLELEDASMPEEERKLQAEYRACVINAMGQACDPQGPDFMVFDRDGQPLVDAAFLAHGLLRARTQITDKLPETTRQNLIRALESSRQIMAYNSNWIFFSAMVEAGLCVLGAPWDKMRVAYALRGFEEWYKGDGIYGDGKDFHWDYYNSFVIQPMYVDLVELFQNEWFEFAAMRDAVRARAARYAQILERMIAADGTYPIVGRSICYRFGVFHMLAQAMLEHLCETPAPEQVRCGLTAVIRKVMENPEMFDSNGYLQPGVYGLQPELAEEYINIGSLYLCSAVFLPLGLPCEDRFWAAKDKDWSNKAVWNGGHIEIDHAL